MYTVGLDKIDSLILYFQQSSEEDSETSLSQEESNLRWERRRRGKIEKSSGPVACVGKVLPFSSQTKEIIFGSLLGDGKLEMPPRSKNARFGFIQAEDKRDYFISVLNSLSSISSGKYREYSYIDKRTNKTYKSLNFWSKALPKLNEFYTKFYNGKVKIVPRDLSLLTPLALAHWVSQKGLSGVWRGLYIITDGFECVDIKRLQVYLMQSYNIKCSIHKVKGNLRIYVLPKSVETLENLILPFTVLSDKVKLENNISISSCPLLFKKGLVYKPLNSRRRLIHTSVKEILPVVRYINAPAILQKNKL